MADIRIREMTIDDYGQAVELWKNTEGIDLSLADSLDNISRYLDRNPGFSFVALQGNAIIGTILCGHDGRRGYIHHLAVHETCRRKGLGRRLVARCLRELAAARIEKCHLFVLAGNEPGLAFWTRTGWTRRDELYVVSRTLRT